MCQLKLSPECILDKSSKVIVNELLKGSYIIIADLHPDLLLQNVLHWNKKRKAFEIFTLFEEANKEQYNLRFEHAICFCNKDRTREKLVEMIELSLPECDLLIMDIYNSLDTKNIYGKSGNVYRNVGLE